MIPPNGFVSNRVLKLNVGFLLSQSLGTSREVEFDVPPLLVADDLKLAFLRGTLRLSRTSEGILVQGVLESSVEGECRRCLSAMSVPITLHIQELFALGPGKSEFFIDDAAVMDLTPLLREEVIINIPLAPLCRPDCAGLCPQCGHNLNLGPCDCLPDDIDPRFAVLTQLKKPE